MSRTMSMSRLTAVGLCLAAGAFFPAAVPAQSAPGTAYAPSLSDAVTDSMLVIVEWRDLEAIEFDRDVALRKRSSAEAREATARTFQSRAATKIKIKDTEITALKARIAQAKSERDELQKRQLEKERDVADVEKQLLKRREQLRQRDIGLAKAEVEFHAAEAKGYELELELARARARRVIVDPDPTRERIEAAWKLEQHILDVEGQTLDAKREASGKLKNLADQSAKAFAARKKVWEAQRDLIKNTAGTP